MVKTLEKRALRNTKVLAGYAQVLCNVVPKVDDGVRAGAYARGKPRVLLQRNHELQVRLPQKLVQLAHWARNKTATLSQTTNQL